MTNIATLEWVRKNVKKRCERDSFTTSSRSDAVQPKNIKGKKRLFRKFKKENQEFKKKSIAPENIEHTHR